MNEVEPVPEGIVDLCLREMAKAVPEIERRERRQAELAQLARMGLTAEERQAVLDIRRRNRRR